MAASARVAGSAARAACRRFLSLDEIARLLDAMEGRDRLVARICIVLGLRPGEVFATDSEIKDTKTPGSRAWVWLPKSITGELSKWRAVSASTLIFPSRSARPIGTRNLLRRHIWPAAVRAGIMPKKAKDWPKGKPWVDPATPVNFRAFRRTCATWFHETAGTKNTQALLRHTTPMTTLGVEDVRFSVEIRGGSPDHYLPFRRPWRASWVV